MVMPLLVVTSPTGSGVGYTLSDHPVLCVHCPGMLSGPTRHQFQQEAANTGLKNVSVCTFFPPKDNKHRSLNLSAPPSQCCSLCFWPCIIKAGGGRPTHGTAALVFFSSYFCFTELVGQK